MASPSRPVLIAAALAVVGLAGVGALALVPQSESSLPDAAPTPSSSVSASPAPSTAPSRPSASPTGSPADVGTQFGAAAGGAGGNFAVNLASAEEALGRFDAVRVFYTGAPDPWPGRVPGRDAVVSFKLPPKQVLAGEFDDEMREWFASAPRELDIHWVYQHEPENDADDGAFEPADFRAAFARLSGMAREAGNPRLRATLVLMSFTLKPGSGRDWRDFYPGDEAVDVFGWDAYNRPSDDVPYEDPQELLGELRAISASKGKAFAIAEFGSILAPGDAGPGRAAWLRSVGQWLAANPTEFFLYFNVDYKQRSFDYRLSDPESQQAWREISGA